MPDYLKVDAQLAGRGPEMFGIRFSQASRGQIVEEAMQRPVSGQGVRLTVTANVDHIVLLRHNEALRTAYHHAWWRTIDGTPVYLYARLRGIGVPERVTGADLLPALLERVTPGAQRLFFVVANEDIKRALVDWSARRGLSNEVAIVIPPFGFESDAAYGAGLANQIRDHRTTLLIFGVGCPRSEVWIDRHREQLGDCYAFAVGAAVAFFVGTQKRAPVIFQKIGMEWAWRVMEEPRRLAKRYLVSSWSFLLAVRDDLRSRSNRTD